ncbi:UDP-2,4-diacetamido-2,4,6-trideoxy-beta-L-altropyranose hydrolase [Endozoicomonas arenosclerae]|uniref:UDP-2,4-diacetamido-2,4, 6-trideoxy-beta-L-altropyranose hydrolase n=1 Tax=Endozoicomonas arenosclerae TaxID=1633495 RepID=UPI0007855595|nr:UDP-2,4-diacetamido-2,4,6-trideoxy-beta-L-altropyranose hydrolase [Endozoicomonas arenosclerae]
MKAVFRVDAASHIGTGHVMRCLTLAEAMREKGFEVQFISRLFQGHMLDKIRSAGFNTLSLSSTSTPLAPLNQQDYPSYKNWLGTSWQNDAEETLSLMDTPCDWLVVDHYALDNQWEKKLRSKAKHILAIDDLADRQHDCELILDQNVQLPGKGDYKNLTPESTECLLGTEYCLLRPEFQCSYPKPPSDKFKVLLFMGGADASSNSLKILSELKAVEALELSVLIQSIHPDYPIIKEMCARFGHECLTESHNMAELIALHNAAIIACGFVSYETAALNIPALLIPLSDIQNQVADRLVELGTGIKIMPESLNTQQLVKSIEQLKNLDTDHQLAFQCDGTDKVVKAMLEISNRDFNP